MNSDEEEQLPPEPAPSRPAFEHQDPDACDIDGRRRIHTWQWIWIENPDGTRTWSDDARCTTCGIVRTLKNDYHHPDYEKGSHNAST